MSHWLVMDKGHHYTGDTSIPASSSPYHVYTLSQLRRVVTDLGICPLKPDAFYRFQTLRSHTDYGLPASWLGFPLPLALLAPRGPLGLAFMGAKSQPHCPTARGRLTKTTGWCGLTYTSQQYHLPVSCKNWLTLPIVPGVSCPALCFHSLPGLGIPCHTEIGASTLLWLDGFYAEPGWLFPLWVHSVHPTSRLCVHVWAFHGVSPCGHSVAFSNVNFLLFRCVYDEW